MSDTFELTHPISIETLADVGDSGEFFASFIDISYAELVKSGVEETKASSIIAKVVCKLSSAFAGETFYITKKPVIFARQMAMYADLQTMPHYDVDKKYGVSCGYSLKVAKQIESKRQHRDQLRLDLDF